MSIVSTLQAHILCFAYTVSYVGSLYLSKHSRLSFVTKPKSSSHPDYERLREEDERWRDDPDVIKARLSAVSIATLVSLGIYSYIAPLSHLKEVLKPKMNLYPYLITPALFLGSLYVRFTNQTLPMQARFRGVKDTFATWIGLRNYVVAPITEELVFRMCILGTYRLSGAGKWKMVFLSPLWFGLAHLHHAYDTYNRYGRTKNALKRAVRDSLFQILYTSLFGQHASYLFLRSSSILPPITAHIFCNIMGLPDWHGRPEYRRRIRITYALGILLFIWKLGAWAGSEIDR